MGGFAMPGGEDHTADPEEELEIPTPKVKGADPCLSPEQIDLLARLAGFSPHCEELMSTGVPAGRAVGPDIVWVFPNRQEDYYYVLAAHFPGDGSHPVTAWTGAGLSGAIEQFCNRAVAESEPGT
jgi:hypothetical protein